MSKQSNKWRTVQLPAPIVDKIEVLVNKQNSPYSGISDFITYALLRDKKVDLTKVEIKI